WIPGASVASLALYEALAAGAREIRIVIAVVIVIVLLGLAGRWDDRRGDERPRGFSGHLGAARRGRLTGGTVKLVAGGVTGLGAGALVATTPVEAIEIGLLIALVANLLNLLDRAPGRAGKAGFVGGIILLLVGDPWWALASAGLLGALLVCMPQDLGERGMLGDEGANPLGGVIGLGLGVSLPEPARLIALVIVLGLNLASERWSFSRVIDTTPVLRSLDRLGRK
ncbi:MAG: hypothetical protein M3345_04715, partial [Actinomycetota bacterium]|nr:hypothetical protein [Actinomycetota bacterium]